MRVSTVPGQERPEAAQFRCAGNMQCNGPAELELIPDEMHEAVKVPIHAIGPITIRPECVKSARPACSHERNISGAGR